MSKVLRQLTTIQRSSAIAIMGTLQSALTSSLDVCAFLLPAILTVEKWCLGAATHLAAVPLKHPLYKQVRTSISCSTMCHSTPIQILFANFAHDPKLIKKKPTKPQNPVQRGSLPFVTNIPPTKEASVREAMQSQEVIKIFMDGSSIGGNVGATAILTHTGQPHQMLHFHLGPDGEHTVHEAELVGILLAVHLI